MVITDINQLDFNKKYTYADYLLWQFSERVELIKGRIFKMSPAPKRIHQEIVGNLYRDISSFVKRENCKVYVAPFDVRLSKKKKDQLIETVIQPDICVICDSSKLDERGCLGAPDLIVEVLSRSTSKKDLNEKKELYEENGVIEYWVVHPTEATLTKFVLENKKYRIVNIFTEVDMVKSTALKDFELNLNEVFN
ncbi:MAG: Uma2 family endonuclease [Polaribacter sp.]